MSATFASAIKSTMVLVVLFFIAFMVGRYVGNLAPPGPLRYLGGTLASVVVFVGGFFALRSIFPNF